MPETETMIEGTKSDIASLVEVKDGTASEELKNEGESVRDGQIQRITRISSILTVIVSGLALFSDGYNAQIIGYMKPLFKELYKDAMSSTISSRLTNSYLIGEIFGMLFFGWTIDKLGRRTGIVFATLFLVLGIVIASE
jgi:fucose permease